MWWLLVRMAGWEGINSTTNTDVLKIKTKELHVFPNPGNGLFMISAQSLKSIEVFDSKGNSIIDKSVKNNVCELDLTNYSEGIYYLKAKAGSSFVEKKLVKIK